MRVGLSAPELPKRSIRNIDKRFINRSLCRFSSAVEQRFCKPLVGSSILSTGTNEIKGLVAFFVGLVFPEKAIGKIMGRQLKNGRGGHRTVQGVG
jgi:hypothetical protein